MENRLLDDQLTKSEGLFLSTYSKDQIKIASKWAKFLSFVGFVFSFLMFFLGIFFGNFNSGKSDLGSTTQIENNIEQFASVFYFILGVLLIYPYFKLFQFGKNGKIALENNDQNALEISLNGMSSFFKFSAYITIIVFFIFLVMGMFI
jgi:heme/copper-type cytochrome/quinol oxidase subunit 2